MYRYVYFEVLVRLLEESNVFISIHNVAFLCHFNFVNLLKLELYLLLSIWRKPKGCPMLYFNFFLQRFLVLHIWQMPRCELNLSCPGVK